VTAIDERLVEVFRDVFDDPDLLIDASTTAEDIDGWDSLQHINLLFAVEQEFGVAFSGDEGAALADVGQLQRLLDDRRV
jgi:acyl carrier protein